MQTCNGVEVDTKQSTNEKKIDMVKTEEKNRAKEYGIFYIRDIIDENTKTDSHQGPDIMENLSDEKILWEK